MNTTHSYLAKQGRDKTQAIVDGTETFGLLQPPDGVLMQTELAIEIKIALENLTPSLRAAIVLVCLQGQTTKDAAKIEGCSTDTMYWRVHEARRQLKKLLAEHVQ